MLLSCLGDAAIPARRVERINVGIKNDVIEVPDDNRQTSQHRFVAMNRQRPVRRPARQESRHIQLEPDDQTGHAYEDRTQTTVWHPLFRRNRTACF